MTESSREQSIADESESFKYFAFLSYSRKDRFAASWLQKRLEWFRFPVKLVDEEFRPPHPRFIRPIYRDKTNLEVNGENYWNNIRRALAESRYLIVLCSPNAAKSEPVDSEVRHFLATHGNRASMLAPIILSGEVSAESSEDVALCPALRELGVELTGRNLPTMTPDSGVLEKEGWEQGFIGLVSFLISVHPSAISDHIRTEETRQAKHRKKVVRRWLALVASLVFVSLIVAAVAWDQAIQTKRNRDEAWLQESKVWIERARIAKRTGDHFSAIMLAGRAIGFKGVGRRPREPEGFDHDFPALLGEPVGEKDFWSDQYREFSAAKTIIDETYPRLLPFIYRFEGLRAPINSLAFSPDSIHVACVRSGNEVNVCNLVNGLEVVNLQKNKKWVSCATFTPDGLRVLGGTLDEITIWDATSGQILHSLKADAESVKCVAVSPRGTQFASVADDHTIRLWDANDYHEIATLSGHEDEVNAIAYSPDGTQIVSASRDGTVRLWETNSGKLISIAGRHDRPIYSVLFFPNGKYVVSGSADQTIKVWALSDGNEQMSLPGEDAMALSPDGWLVTRGPGDWTVKFWNLRTGVEVAHLNGSVHVSDASFSPDGTLLASTCLSHLTLWDVSPGEQLTTLAPKLALNRTAAISPNGELVATATTDNSMVLSDVESGVSLAVFPPTANLITQLLFSPDSDYLAVVSGSEIVVWDLSTGREFATLNGHQGSVTGISFGRDHKTLVSGSGDDTGKRWDVVGGKELVTLQGHAESIYDIVISPDSRRIATSSWDHTIRLWDAELGTQLFLLRTEGKTLRLAFSPDSSLLAGAEPGSQYEEFNSLGLWNTTNGKEQSLTDQNREEALRWLTRRDQTCDAAGRFTLDTTQDRPTIHQNKRTDIDLATLLRSGLFHFSFDGTNKHDAIATSSPRGWKRDATTSNKEVPTPRLRHPILALLATPTLSPAKRAELEMLLCARSGQFLTATAQWQRLMRGEWPDFVGLAVSSEWTQATVANDSLIRRIYLIALIDAANRGHQIGHPATCEAAEQLSHILTQEMMALPTVSLAMMSLMQRLSADDDPAMIVIREALIGRLQQTAASEWLDALHSKL